MENIVEEFRDIPGYEGLYQASSLGNIKSLGNNNFRKEKILKPGLKKSGYYDVRLSKNGKAKSMRVHKLVAMAFLAHKPDGTMNIVVDHINNVKTDNRVENLQLITIRENSSKDKKGYSSKYVGVCWYKRKMRWIASIRINGKCKNLGYFKNEYDAHLKYQETLKTLKSC